MYVLLKLSQHMAGLVSELIQVLAPMIVFSSQMDIESNRAVSSKNDFGAGRGVGDAQIRVNGWMSWAILKERLNAGFKKLLNDSHLSALCRLILNHNSRHRNLSLKSPTSSKRSLVPAVGIEPTRPCGLGILNPVRLPIPPHRLRCGQSNANGRPSASKLATQSAELLIASMAAMRRSSAAW